MMSEKLEKIFLWAIKILSAAILFLPLFIYRPVLYPYIFSKIIVFQILVEIIFVLWLVLLLYSKEREKYKINWRHPLILALTIFVGALILTMFTGADISQSFWSSQERMTGILTIIHFYVWFLAISSCFSVSSNKKENWKSWKILLWVGLINSFLVGLYGLGQKIGLEFLLKNAAQRMSSTLGNPDFLGAYSLVCFFLSLFLFLKSDKKTEKVFVGLLAVFNLIVLTLTATRAALLGLIAAIFLFSFYLIFRKETKKKIKLLVSLFIILIVLGSLFLKINYQKEWMKKAPLFVRRLTQISYQTGEARLISWGAGLKGFAEKPILGWGWENYNLVFNRFYNPWYLSKGAANTWFDKSHNQVIDLLALTGILGTLAYLIIFVSIFFLFLKLNRRVKLMPPQNYQVEPNQNKETEKGMDYRRDLFGLLILGLMFFGYFIQNLFIFDTPAPLIVFYFSLALVYFLTRDMAIFNSSLRKKFSVFPLPVFIILILIFLPWGIYKFNLEPFQQSRLGIRAFHTAKQDLKSALYWYEKALAKPCFVNSEIRAYFAKDIAEAHAKINEKTNLDILGQGTEIVITEYEKMVQKHPLNSRHWLYLGQLYGLGAKYNLNYLQKAKTALETALELSPQRQQIYFELARIYYFQKEYKKAINFLEQATVLNPEVRESQQKLQEMIGVVEKEAPDLEDLDKAKKFLKYLVR